MKIINLILALVFLVGGTLIYIDSKPEKNRVVTNEVMKLITGNNKFPAIVALTLNNKITCTGSVIDSNTVLTAAHCVDDLNSQLSGVVVMSLTLNNRLKIVKTVVDRFNLAQDTATLVGDFREFNKLQIDSSPEGDILFNDVSYVNCGFPYGGSLVCYSLSSPKKYGFKILFDGQVYSSMSGGPVIDLNSGIIRGITFGFDNYSKVSVSPIINFRNAF